MEDLIDGYKSTRRTLRALRTLNTDKAERGVIGGMISDCQYTLEWLQTGRRPGNRRGIERRAAYQRERPMDPLRMQAYMSQSSAGSPANITDGERERLDMALSVLSERERECYELHYGKCYSFAEIANLLGIAKGTVHDYLKRAEEKIRLERENNIFLI